LQCGTIECEYAKKWEKLATKTAFQEKGYVITARKTSIKSVIYGFYSGYSTVRTGLDGLHDFVDVLSKEHGKVFTVLQADITAPLEVTKKNQADDKNMVRLDILQM